LGQVQNVGTKDAENVYAPLVVVSMLGRKRTLADKTVYQNGSIDICREYIFLQTAIAMKDIFRNSSPQNPHSASSMCNSFTYVYFYAAYIFLALLYQLAVLEVVSQWKYSS
jgi:hypothetical protein